MLASMRALCTVMMFAPARSVARLASRCATPRTVPTTGFLQPHVLSGMHMQQRNIMARMMATEAAEMSPVELSELEGQIKAQGDEVRAAKEALKAGIGEKSTVDAAVAVLLELKGKLPADPAVEPKKQLAAEPKAKKKGGGGGKKTAANTNPKP